MTPDELRSAALADLDQILGSRIVRDWMTLAQVRLLTAARQQYATDDQVMYGLAAIYNGLSNIKSEPATENVYLVKIREAELRQAEYKMSLLSRNSERMSNAGSYDEEDRDTAMTEVLIAAQAVLIAQARLDAARAGVEVP